ncbi:PaaI family thioesterase, partial [Acidimicrobiia bacterium]|nr:PaaI family thioesterase [Acidimicrobiia bacterium]
ISGISLPLPSKTVWEEGMLLQDIYPDSSFVSGSKNPQSMRMKPIVKNNFVYANYIFEDRFAGGPGLVHGGILSAALDDLMGYATVLHNRMCVTANLEVNFITPVPVEQEYELFAWVKDIDGKKISTESVIRTEENIHVESRALFIDLGENAFKHFAPEKNYP